MTRAGALEAAQRPVGPIPRIDVCVATYKRPDGLRRLLRSLRAQESGGEFTFSIIVADNDVQQSAEPVVGDSSEGGQEILYVVAPQQNISLARNKALSLATGQYVATIDDDEHADPHWLLALYRALLAHRADLCFGPVVPLFHDDAPEYFRRSGAFHLPDPPSGSSDHFVPSTGNSLFRRALIQNMTAPFDPAFGRTGGGDTAFFEVMRQQGWKRVWSREALVFETIPPERTTWRWILQREFCRGNVYHRVYNRGHVNPELPRAAKIVILGKRMIQRLLPALLYVLASALGSTHMVKAVGRLRSAAFYAGAIAHFLGFHYTAYRAR